MSAFGQHAETEIRLNALSARITQLEALIREVFIPDVQSIRETAGKPEDTYIKTKVLEIKLREAIK